MTSANRVLTALLVLPVCLLAGCGWFGSQDGQPVARVGDAVLTEGDLERLLSNDVFEEKSAEARRRAVARWVNREILSQEAVRRGYDRDPLVKLQLETARRDILVNTLLDRLQANAPATEDELSQFYEANRNVFKRSDAMIHVRQIVIENPKEARRIAVALQRNPDLFAETARTASSDPSSADGGDVGFVTAQTAYSPEVWQVLERMSAGEVSRPIPVDAGWIILQAVEQRSAGSIKPLDEVRSEVVNRLRAAGRANMMIALAESLKLKENVEVFAERVDPARRSPRGESPQRP